ncbi:hypothetical protein [Burkholderia pseudomallei]|uniref:hypothetical protein n=1 Tax=Burkholderia pseudomallei TaxID=28450 RepID=UPI003F682E25
MELALKSAATRAQRAVLYRLRAEQKINDERLAKLMREVYCSETALPTRRKGTVRRKKARRTVHLTNGEARV